MAHRNFSHTSNYLFGTNLLGDETVYAIQEVNLPGLSFSHIQASKNSANLFLQGDTLNFNDLTVNIIVDEELTVWKDIVNKMFKMREQYEGTGQLVDLENSMSWLEIQDDNTNKILKLEFYNCMIESIDDLSYNSTGEDDVITVSLTLKYDFYKIA